jgi:cell division protein FtsB
LAKPREFLRIGSKGFLLLLLFFLFILVLAFFFGDRGILEIVKSKREIRALQEEVRRLEVERDTLAQAVRELQGDPAAIEKRAREKLWLMKKNEKVVVLPPPPGDKKK